LTTARARNALFCALFFSAGLAATAAAQPAPDAAHDALPLVSADGIASSSMPAVMPHMAGLAMANATDSSATAAFKHATGKMHAAMDMGYSEDADVDFVRGMIAHHQGAIDMANAVLKYGSDPDVRMLAGDIVKAQEKEIDWMKDWLAKHGPRDLSASPSLTIPAAMTMPDKAPVDDEAPPAAR
jgi:hypothetical protein